MYEYYNIWMQYTARQADHRWKKTKRQVKGRTVKEANSRMRRMFSGAGFSSMRLVAIKEGFYPEHLSKDAE